MGQHPLSEANLFYNEYAPKRKYIQKHRTAVNDHCRTVLYIGIIRLFY